MTVTTSSSVVAEDRRGQRARLLDRDSLGDRVAVLGAAGERAHVLGLDADEPDAGAHGAERDRDSGRQAAAADRDHERAHVGQLLGQLEPDRPLPGDHALVLEGVGRALRLPVCGGVVERGGERLLEVVSPWELRVGAVVPGRLDLRHRRVVRHEEIRGDRARLACGPGDRLAVVSGTGGDYAGSVLLRA